jgi:hypothetical protein
MRQIPVVNEPGSHNKKAFPTNYQPAMSFEEIAAAMGCRRQTVFVIYARALDKIRRELRRRGQQSYPELLDHTEISRGPALPDWGK